MHSTHSIRVAAWSDQGRERDYQEDNYCVGANPELNSWVMPQDAFSPGNHGVLLAVADGMGGLNAGEVASRLAVEGVKAYFDSGRLPSGGLENQNPGVLLRECILYANTKIVEHARRNPDAEGMGTTLVIAWMLGSIVYVGWSGDSRCYLLRRGQMRQISRDHSYVQELVDSKTITEEEAFYHPNKNIITQSLGDSGKPPEPEIAYFPLQPGDRILVCSDGLNSMLHDHEIAPLLAGGDVGYAARALVDAANEAGGHDNITVVIGELQGDASAATPYVETNAPEFGRVAPVYSKPIGKKRISPAMMAALLILIPIIIILFIFSTFNLFENSNDPVSTKNLNQIKNHSTNNTKNSSIDTINRNNDEQGIEKGKSKDAPAIDIHSDKNSKRTESNVSAEDQLMNTIKDTMQDLLKRHSRGVCNNNLREIEKDFDKNSSFICDKICKKESSGCGIEQLKSICECEKFNSTQEKNDNKSGNPESNIIDGIETRKNNGSNIKNLIPVECGGAYGIQVGTFNEKNNAKNKKNECENAGYSACINENSNKYRVIIYGLPTEKEAREQLAKVKDKIKECGDCKVVKIASLK